MMSRSVIKGEIESTDIQNINAMPALTYATDI